MARPRKDTPLDRFTSAEMAEACGITFRNFGHLVDAGLAPQPADGGEGGQASARVWDSFGLSHAAVTGALHRNAGIELFLAAKIANCFVQELIRGGTYDRFPSGIDSISEKLPDLKETDDFWIHHRLRSFQSVYERGKRRNSDVILEIVDRKYLFTRTARQADLSDPMAKILSWERAKEAEVISIEAELYSAKDKNKFNDVINTSENEFRSGRENAVAVIEVNISLAIRNAFDSLADYRFRTGKLTT